MTPYTFKQNNEFDMLLEYLDHMTNEEKGIAMELLTEGNKKAHNIQLYNDDFDV